MTAQFDVIFPARGRQMLDGGLNNKFERSLIPDNESPDCYNVVFSNGAVATRPGSVKLNATAIGTFTIDGLYTRHDTTGAETMVVFAGGTAWNLTGASTFVTIASAQSVFTVGVRVGATEMENHLFSGNGFITPYKWNGTYWTRHGVPAATGAVSVASATTSTGVLSGDYRYKVTFVNSQAVEGDVGTSTVTFTATSAKLLVTGIPTAPQSHGVSARRLYRTASSGTTWKRVTEISDNTTTTYVDNTADASLGVNAPTDNGEPPKYSVIVQHQGRLFCNDAANPNFVWYSNVLEPYTFASTNFQSFGDASLDLVRGLVVYNNSILVLAERSMYLWYMPSTDDTEWRVIKIVSPFGSKSPFGTFAYNNKLMVPATQNGKFVGFAAVTGSTIDPASSELAFAREGSDLQSDRIEPDIFNVQEAYIANISAMAFKNKAYLAVTYGANQTTNNRIYIFDFSRSNLSKTEEATWVPFTGLNAAQFTVYGGSLYYGSSTATGFIYQLESSLYSDDGTAVDSYFWTKEFSGQPGHENFQKDFRFVKLLVDKAGPYYMTLTIRTDSDSGGGNTKQIDLTPGSMIWGTGVWGLSLFGSGASQAEITVPLGVSGKRIQLKFSNQNTAGQRFKVHGININYNIKGKR
jgi:hypothetical protein